MNHVDHPDQHPQPQAKKPSQHAAKREANLRANLLRRKQQAKARTEHPSQD